MAKVNMQEHTEEKRTTASVDLFFKHDERAMVLSAWSEMLKIQPSAADLLEWLKDKRFQPYLNELIVSTKSSAGKGKGKGTRLTEDDLKALVPTFKAAFSTEGQTKAQIIANAHKSNPAITESRWKTLYELAKANGANIRRKAGQKTGGAGKPPELYWID